MWGGGGHGAVFIALLWGGWGGGVLPPPPLQCLPGDGRYALQPKFLDPDIRKHIPGWDEMGWGGVAPMPPSSPAR